MIYVIYNTNTGEIRQSIDIPEFMEDIIELNQEEALVEIPRTAHDTTEYIKDGKLTPKPIVEEHIPVPDIEELQATAWELIKERRLQAVTSGVYITSLDKSVHTDATTVAQYGQIGSSIVLGTFEEMNWKAMDNTFFAMTESVFKEIQTEMMRQTQRYHAKAEYHKVMMLAANDPLSYNYHDDW